jgi:hypothetical protein
MSHVLTGELIDEEDDDDDDDATSRVPRDLTELRERLCRQILDALVPAVAKLCQSARSGDALQNDHALRACIALARLAPSLINHTPPAIAPQPSLIHPDLDPEVAKRLIEEMVAAGRDAEARGITYWGEGVSKHL